MVRRVPSAADGVSYYLAHWEDHHLMRNPQGLDSTSLEQLKVEHEVNSRPAPPIFILPFYGMLPAADQLERELDQGVSPSQATLASSLALLTVSMPLTVIGLLMVFDSTNFGVTHPEYNWVARSAVIWFYLFIESFARLLLYLWNSVPSGTLPVVLAVGTPRAIRQHFENKRLKRERRTAAPLHAQKLFHAIDQVRPLNGHDPPSSTKASLEILSPLPKPDWTLGRTLVHFEKNHYLVTDRSTEGIGQATRFRFVLEPLDSEVLHETPVEYHPGEAGNRARQSVRDQRLPWISGLSFFWGFLSSVTQRRLEQVFFYEPEASSLLNTKITFFLATTTSILALMYVIGSAGGLIDLVLLLASTYLTWESRHRRKQLLAGHLTGSIVGPLFEPFARRLLRDL